MQFLFKLVIPVIVIYFAFKTNVWLGVAAIIAVTGALIYLNRANYYVFQANTAQQQGNMEAVLKFLKAATNVPNCPPQHFLSYGYILLRKGDVQQAETIFRDLLKKQLPKSLKLTTEMNMALIKWKQGRLDDAIELMENIYDVYKTTDVYGTLGYLYIEKGDAEKALTFNEEAYDYNEENGVIRDNLAIAYSMNGNDERALELLEALIDEHPSFPEPYVHYGELLIKQGKREEAIRQFEKALELPVHYLSTVSHDDIRSVLEEAKVSSS